MVWFVFESTRRPYTGKVCFIMDAFQLLYCIANCGYAFVKSSDSPTFDNDDDNGKMIVSVREEEIFRGGINPLDFESFSRALTVELLAHFR